MRNIQTVIVHVLWDDQEPDTLRGSLRLVTNDLVQTFGNQQELISLLQEMIRHPAEESLPKPVNNKTEKLNDL